MPEYLEIEVRDPRLHDLLEPGTELRCVQSGFEFVEGPVWDRANGCLVFSDIRGNTVYRWSEADGISVLRRPSNMANGNALDRQGRLLSCEHATSRVVRAEPDGTTTVLAAQHAGKQLNSPNDIVVRSDGTVFFTDPTSGRTARWGVEREAELAYRGVYRVVEGAEPELLADDFAKPNGLCFSLDEQRLFVNDTDRGHIRVFEVRDGALHGGQVWAALTGSGDGVADGMKVDAAGNLFCTGPGGIHVFDADAACLGVIRMPERSANFAWGEADRRTMFVTASTSLYALRTIVPGQTIHE